MLIIFLRSFWSRPQFALFYVLLTSPKAKCSRLYPHRHLPPSPGPLGWPENKPWPSFIEWCLLMHACISDPWTAQSGGFKIECVHLVNSAVTQGRICVNSSFCSFTQGTQLTMDHCQHLVLFTSCFPWTFVLCTRNILTNHIRKCLTVQVGCTSLGFLWVTKRGTD